MRNVFEYYDEGIYLEHHGIKGQKLGERRFQNPDGSLTPEGRKRYGASDKLTEQYRKVVDVTKKAEETGRSKDIKRANVMQLKMLRDRDRYAKKYDISFDKDNDRVIATKKSKARYKYDKKASKMAVKINNLAATKYLNGPNGALAKLNEKWIAGDFKGYEHNVAAAPNYLKYVQEANSLIQKYNSQALVDLLGERPD